MLPQHAKPEEPFIALGNDESARGLPAGAELLDHLYNMLHHNVAADLGIVRRLFLASVRAFVKDEQAWLSSTDPITSPVS